MSNMFVTLNTAINTVNGCQDCGSFYFYDPAGGSTGIVYSYNSAFNRAASAQAGKGSVCFYEDAGTAGMLLKGNIMSACGDWSIKTGCSPGATNVTEFNIIDATNNTANSGGVAFANEYPCSGNPGYTFKNNIVYDGNNSWLSYMWWIEGLPPQTNLPTVTTNLWYSPAGNAPSPFGIVNGAGPASISNTNAFNANPLFVNPAVNNYALSPSSPAYADIGWTTLPTDQGPLPYSPP
jgi:hypothetical protein